MAPGRRDSLGAQQGHVDGVTLAAFGGAVVIGGANFVAVKLTVEELDPLWGAASRFAVAALVFLAILAATRNAFPRGAALVGAALYGALGFGIAYALMYVALVELSVGVASVLMATVPILTLLLAALQRVEPLTGRGLLGGALALVGIAVLSARSFGGDVPFRYFLAALIAPIVVAQSAIVLKRFPRTHPVTTNAVGMLVGAALLALASLVVGETWALPREAGTWAATAWLVVAGSVGLFWLFVFVVGRWTASASTYALPLMPIVAVALGAALLDETIGLLEAAGAVLVIGGAYVGALLPGRRRPDIAPADPGGCAAAGAAVAGAPETPPAAAPR